ncbi:MAG: polysaccharide deacetylase family protein [Actinomycetota bacterium]|nr:polysaccharide deacetylase family protein [Actinomycetota bacterium]
MHRRAFLSSLGLGALVAVTGCGGVEAAPTPRPTLPPISPPRPGPATVLYAAAEGSRQIALTIDDGYSDDCVEGYLRFAEQSGIPVTFLPNGIYADTWDPRAERLRSLIETGQVQIGNHTMSHLNLLESDDATIRADIEANEQWIQRVFGVTARPYLRPPYGARDDRTDRIAADLGYTRITMWNGTLGDSGAIDPAVLMDLARTHVQPGAIVLGHANSPTVLGLLDGVRDLIIERDLQPVTLDTMFGTSRAQG